MKSGNYIDRRYPESESTVEGRGTQKEERGGTQKTKRGRVEKTEGE